MPSADWQINGSQFEAHELSTSQAVIGAKSLRTFNSLGPSGITSATKKTFNAANGKVRTRFRTTHLDQVFIGVVLMAKLPLVSESDAYYAFFRNGCTEIGLLQTIFAGISLTPQLKVAHNLNGGTLATNTWYAIEGEWKTDSDTGYRVITVRAGTTFADMIDYIYFVDKNVLTWTTGSLGIFGYAGTGTANTRSIYFDDTHIYG